MTPEILVRNALNAAGVPASAPVGVALSGGGDSVALLHALAQSGHPLRALTVDHGLRDVADELALCAEAARALGVPHEVIRWDWDGRGNLQAAARQGRMQALSHWARAHGIAHIAIGHTRDDQAETVLMRIARGSGIDGLAGMAAARADGDITWLRPLLACSRKDLRVWLRGKSVAWAEDPSNSADRFDRVRARRMMTALGDLGLTTDRLTVLADHAQAALSTLDAAARAWAAASLTIDRGDIVLPTGVPDLGSDSPRRVLAAAMRWIGGGDYRPRWKSLQSALETAATGKQVTLAGCILRPERGALRLTREAADATDTAPVGAVWDGRWRVSGPSKDAALHVARLGETGLAQCADWRESGLPRVSLLASPAVWEGDQLIAAPLAQAGATWQAEIASPFPFSAFALNTGL